MERTELEKLIEANDEQLLSEHGAQLRADNAAHADRLAMQISRAAIAEMSRTPLRRSPFATLDELLSGRRGFAFSAATFVGALLAVAYIVFGGRPATPDAVASMSDSSVAISAQHSGPFGLVWRLPLALFDRSASLVSGDEIQTGAATVTMTFANGTTSVLAPNSLARVESVTPLSVRVIYGSADNNVRPATVAGLPAFQVLTARGSYIARGTVYNVQVAQASDRIKTREGTVAVRTGTEEQLVLQGQQADVSSAGTITPQLSAPDVILTLSGGQEAGPADTLTTNARQVTLTITTAARAQLSIELAQGNTLLPGALTVTADENGKAALSVQLPASEGTFSLRVIASDTSGRSLPPAASTPITIIVDRTAPSRFVLTAPSNNVATSTPARITGITEPGSRMLVNKSPIIVASDGHFTADVPLEVGPNAVEFTVTDAAGNVLRVEETIYLSQ
jgi:hypothetical protein